MYLRTPSKFKKFKFSTINYFIGFAVISSILSVNSLLMFMSLFILIISLPLVWRKNEVPVFAFAIFFHWLQISLKVFQANILGVPISEISLSNSTVEAIYLSLAGVLILSIGIHIVLRTVKCIDLQNLIDIAKQYPIKRFFYVYIVLFLGLLLIGKIIFIIPGISQIVVVFLNLKLVILFYIFIVSLVQKKYKIIIWILLIETIFGFTGFFSGFKDSYIVFFMSYFTLHNKISLKRFFVIIPIIVFVISLGLLWTAIKVDYRMALNQGAQSQEVTISSGKQVEVFIDLVSSLDKNKIDYATNALISRIAYVDLFGQTIDYVPRSIDYAKGELWLGSVLHIFKPRLLFPDKDVLDDSARARKYTGIHYAGRAEGASIGIGYFAESYVDFGPIGMFMPIFFLGLFYGWVYKYILKHTKDKILANALILGTLFLSYQFALSNAKLFGAIVVSFLGLMILKKVFLLKLFRSLRYRNAV